MECLEVKLCSQNLQLADQITALVKEKGCTSGQLTLAWILAQGDDVIPIPGTSKIKNLEENAAAVEIQEIRGACEKEDVAGGRSLEQMAVYLFGDSAPKRN